MKSFISQKFILQTKYQNHEFVAYGDEDDKFAFIVLPGFRAENIPNFKIIKSNKGDVFISLKDINEDCIANIENEIRNKITIEDYLEHFVMPPKTIYKKKKPLIIESESSPKEIKPKKKKIVVEETKPISSEEEFILLPKKRQSKKVIIKGQPKNKTKRQTGIKKRQLLIVENENEKV